MKTGDRSASAARRGGRYIDIHAHIYDPIPEPSDEALGDAVRLARWYGIEHLILVGNATGLISDHNPSPDLVSDINTYTLGAMRRFPDVFIGFCYLNPAHPVGFIEEEIERCIAQGGMRGIKLWVSVKATDSRLDPVMTRAQELGVPVLHHAWYQQTEYSHNGSTPAEIADLGRRFPDVTLVMAHLSGGRERGVLDIADLPNVLVDTSGSQPEAGMVEYAVRHLGAERVVYGSDWPIRDFGTQVARVLSADVSDGAKDLILRGNAARVLGIEETSG